MKCTEWKTYRTRFLVQAKQLNSALSFVDPLGRTHCGRRGDYLVESSDGVISIAPRQIFEDIYVAISSSDSAEAHEMEEKKLADYHANGVGEGATAENRLSAAPLARKRVAAAKLSGATRSEKLCACPTTQLTVEPLDIEEITMRPIASRPASASRDLQRDEPARLRRKLPQSTVNRTSSRLGLM